MIVFKTFFKVFKQYTFLCFMYLGIAIAIIFILANTGSSGSSSYTSTSQGIAVLDKDGSDISKGLIEYLSSINTIMDANDYNDDQIVDFMYYTKISNYLVIPEGFGENFKARALSSDNAAEIMLESTKNAGTTKPETTSTMPLPSGKPNAQKHTNGIISNFISCML